MTRREKIIYLAALLEGEGCFSKSRNHHSNAICVNVHLRMSDEDIVEFALEIANNLIRGGTNLRIRKEAIRTHGIVNQNKPIYNLQFSGEKAVLIMKEVLPFMGLRRSARIKELIQAHESRMTKSEARFRAVARAKRCLTTKDLFS